MLERDMGAMHTLWSAIGMLPDQFPPVECQCYIRHAGYGRAE